MFSGCSMDIPSVAVDACVGVQSCSSPRLVISCCWYSLDWRLVLKGFRILLDLHNLGTCCISTLSVISQ
jgi:hypothetical protein